MNNITSIILQRIINISQINTNDYYLVKDRINKRADYIGYFLTDDEIKKIQGNQYPSKSFFRKIWLRIPRNSETDKYDEWKNVREIQKSNNQINEYLFVSSNNNIINDKVLIYSFGDEMQKLLNEDNNPDLLWQYLYQRKNNVNEEFKTNDDSNGNSRIPSLQFLSSMALPNDDRMLIKENTTLDPNMIPKYLPHQNQNAGQIRMRHRRVKTKKNKSQRKFKKQKKQRKSKKQRK